MSKNEHILCVAAGHGQGCYAPKLGFAKLARPLSEEIEGDLWVGPRPRLEVMRPCLGSEAVATLLDGLAGMAERGSGMNETSVKRLIGDFVPNIVETYGGGRLAYPPFIQIIPYFLFRHAGKYLYYVRPDKGSEARLHGKLSIGIGGHIDLTDLAARSDKSIDLERTLETAGRREASEEIGLDPRDIHFTWVATLYATDTEVDRVHLGIIGVCDLRDEQLAQIKPNDEISSYGFKTLSEINAVGREGAVIETWSRLVIEANPLA